MMLSGRKIRAQKCMAQCMEQADKINLNKNFVCQINPSGKICMLKQMYEYNQVENEKFFWDDKHSVFPIYRDSLFRSKSKYELGLNIR